MATWYSIENKADNPEVFIFDEIGGFGVTAQSFISEINGLGDFTLRLNSGGGSVFDGNAISNAIKSHKGNVTIRVEGIAASIASIIALSGTVLEMAENSFIMIHNATAGIQGDASEMRKMADTVDKISEGLINTYVGSFNIDREAIIAMMNEETWLSPADLQNLGVDVVITNALKVAAKADKFNIPTKVSNIITMENNDEKVGVLDKVLNHIGNTKELKAELATSITNLTESVKEVADLKASLEEAEVKNTEATEEVAKFKNLSEEETAKIAELQSTLEGVVAELEALKGEPAEESTEADASDVQNVASPVVKVQAKRSLKNIMAIHAEKKRNK